MSYSPEGLLIDGAACRLMAYGDDDISFIRPAADFAGCIYSPHTHAASRDDGDTDQTRLPGTILKRRRISISISGRR